MEIIVSSVVLLFIFFQAAHFILLANWNQKYYFLGIKVFKFSIYTANPNLSIRSLTKLSDKANSKFWFRMTFHKFDDNTISFREEIRIFTSFAYFVGIAFTGKHYYTPIVHGAAEYDEDNKILNVYSIIGIGQLILMSLLGIGCLAFLGISITVIKKEPVFLIAAIFMILFIVCLIYSIINVQRKRYRDVVELMRNNK